MPEVAIGQGRAGTTVDSPQCFSSVAAPPQQRASCQQKDRSGSTGTTLSDRTREISSTLCLIRLVLLLPQVSGPPGMKILSGALAFIRTALGSPRTPLSLTGLRSRSRRPFALRRRGLCAGARRSE